MLLVYHLVDRGWSLPMTLPERFTTYIIYIQTHIILKRKKRPNGCVRAPWFANHVECQWQPTPFALLFYYFSMKFHWLHFSSSLWVSVNSEKKVVSMFSYFCVGSAGQNKRLHRLFFSFFLTSLSSPENYSMMRRKKMKMRSEEKDNILSSLSM